MVGMQIIVFVWKIIFVAPLMLETKIYIEETHRILRLLYLESHEKTISHQSKYLYSSKTKDSIEDSYVAENRKRLLENYYKRSCPIPYPHDIGQYIDYNFNKYEGLQIIFDEDEFEYDDAVKFSQL